MMKDQNPLEELLKTLPEAAKQFKEEADNVGRTILNSQLQKADVVTREAFEEQRELLQAALEKLHALEAKVDALTEAKNANITDKKADGYSDIDYHV